MSDFCSPRDIWRECAPMLRPAEEMSVSQCAEKNFFIHTPGGFHGKWETPPYMKRPMDCAASRLYQGIGFMGPAQAAKTMGLVEGVLTYVIKQLHSDALIVHPTEASSRIFSQTRMAHFHNHSDSLSEELVVDNVQSKTYKAGNTVFFGWPTGAQYRGRTVMFVIQTDYDAFPDDIEGEGPGFQLGTNRVKTFMSRGTVIAESSPAGMAINGKTRLETHHHFHPMSGIVSVYLSGTMEQWYWPCSECGEYFQNRATFDEDYLYIPEHSQEDLIDAAAESRLICPHCSALVDIHRHRFEMNALGEWIGVGQTINKDRSIEGNLRRTNVASFGLGGFAAALQKPVDLVIEYLKAKHEYENSGDEDALKTVTNTQMAAPYIPQVSRNDNLASQLQDRAQEFPRGFVSLGGVFLTAGIDIQGGKDKRFVVQIIAWGHGNQCWLVDRFNIRYRDEDHHLAARDRLKVRPDTHLEDWNLLIDKVIKRVYPVDDGSGRLMPILKIGIDHGGEAGVSDNAYDFWRECKKEGLGKKVRLLKGGSNNQVTKIVESFPDNEKRKDRTGKARKDVPLYLLDTTRFKDQIFNNLNREDVGSGYMHFPDWIGGWFYDELTYEERGLKRWEKPGNGNNESFDLYVYNRAVAIMQGLERINWEAPPSWAMPWDENSEIINPEEDESVPVRTRGRRKRRVRGRF